MTTAGVDALVEKHAASSRRCPCGRRVDERRQARPGGASGAVVGGALPRGLAACRSGALWCGAVAPYRAPG